VRYYNVMMDSARWEGVELRADDIIISTPPKCGTTWTQRLCSLVLGVEPSSDMPMAVISPWFEMLTRPRDEVLADLEAQRHRRFIKSHTPLDGLPWDHRVTYIAVGRDPRDVALSWARHMDNLKLDELFQARADAVGLEDLAELMPDGPPPPIPEDPQGRFWHFVGVGQSSGSSVSGLANTVNHLSSFWAARNRTNVHLFHYSDLKADLPGQVQRLAAALGVALDEGQAEIIAEGASIERMRAGAAVVAPNTDHDWWKDRAAFFHSGTSGQWHGVLDGDDLRRYDQIIADMGPPDFVRWLHDGGPTD